MDFRDPKNQKILIGVLAFFVVVYFWYTKVYQKYDSQISLKTQEFETITTNLRNVEMKAKSLDALQIEYEDLIKRYDQIESLLPEVKMIPSLLVQLHTASSLTGTHIKRVKPLPVLSEDFYNITSFEIEMTGGYHDVATFMSYIANFPFIANVGDMRLTALNVAISKDATPKQNGEVRNVSKKKETVTAVFSLSTYYVKESERLQEIEI
jgi:type IV pilus assembly protein PilO